MTDSIKVNNMNYDNDLINYICSLYTQSDEKTTIKISKGTYGKIIKINDNVLLKITDKINKNNTSYVEQNFHEAVFLSSIQHENIIACNKVFIKDSKIILELERGDMTLHDYINNSTLLDRKNKLKYILFQLIKALKFIHDNHFIHGDLKPNNIIYNAKNDVVKLIDFGGLCSFRLNKYIHRPICTPSFCPPEGYKEFNNLYTITDKFDVWSLGMTMYYYITQKYLLDFQHDKTSDYINEFKNKMNYYETPDIDIIKSDTGDLFDIIKKMLIYDKYRRVSSSELYNHQIFSNYIDTHILNNKIFFDCSFNANFTYYYTSQNWNIRQKMIDFVFDMVNKLNCVDHFVITVWLIDKYYYLKNIKPNQKNYKLISCCALFIISLLISGKKIYFDDFINSFFLHNYSKNDIIKKIDDILCVNNFKVYAITFDQYITNIDYNVVHNMLRNKKSIGLTIHQMNIIYRIMLNRM